MLSQCLAVAVRLGIIVASAMKGVSNTEQLQEYAQQLAPMGQMGMKIFQSFVEGATAAAASGATGKKPKE